MKGSHRRGAPASLVYDALGRRASKSISGTTTQFLYDGWNPVQELAAGNPPASVTANLLTGLHIDEFFTRTASSTTSTLLADALGSTIGLVGSGGTIGTSYTYQPFGATTSGGAGNSNPYQFTGREDGSTGLYYYRARYYSPTFQRFIAQDPIGLGGGDLNLYSYSSNRPTGLRDPLGLWSVTIGGYWGFGGTLTFGRNPNGTDFVSLGGGGGAGVILGSYNPNGTSSGYENGGLPCRNSGWHFALGPIGSVGLGAGALGIGAGASFPIEFARDYSSQGESTIGPSDPLAPEIEFGLSGSGVEVGGGVNVGTVTYIW